MFMVTIAYCNFPLGSPFIIQPRQQINSLLNVKSDDIFSINQDTQGIYSRAVALWLYKDFSLERVPAETASVPETFQLLEGSASEMLCMAVAA